MITRGLANIAAILGHTHRPASPRLGPGRRVYAVGDVHGHLDQLVAIHDAIRADLADRPVARPVLVHLGDLIDRGPSSAGVIDLLSRGQPVAGVPVVNLMGNHEWMFLTAIAQRDHASVDHWLDNGGVETLASWGIRAGMPVGRWVDVVPRNHLLFLRGLPAWWQRDGCVFVHAGVRPGIALTEQKWTDLLWIRDTFLEHRGPPLPDAPDVVVVHGHTPSPRPVVRPHRIGVDTGAGRLGPLTCAVLDTDGVRFLQAAPPGSGSEAGADLVTRP